jgi:hypothetical protein
MIDQAHSHEPQPQQPPISTPEPMREAGAPLRTDGKSLRGILEPIAMAIMALGFFMIFQPFAKGLYTYSFIVIIAGTLMFIVVSHLSD